MASADVNNEENVVIWWFNASNDPWSSNETDQKWIKYSDIKNEIIEDAYSKSLPYATIDEYMIDLRRFLQIESSDKTKQRQVRRTIGGRRQECLREERFCYPETALVRSVASYGSGDEWCPFILNWLNSPLGKRYCLNIPECVEAAARGIIREGKLIGPRSEAEWIANQLITVKRSSRKAISKLCVHLFTRDSFLYKLVNETLRENNNDKLETLGPYCYLLRDYGRTCEEYLGTVYRGVFYTPEIIQTYRDSIGQWKTWAGFTSTSKSRELAEVFGNTLLVIDIQNIKLSTTRAYDIEHISTFPIEQEVLLPAGIAFKTIKTEIDQNQKHIIYLQL
ncbi:unnamed protein product [Didymodactylos carnosus]|nr:unnamed protein product [Didymodactylos carnosus]CAF4549764.1 unnamed protein product [Didymodactylos carnosus]